MAVREALLNLVTAEKDAVETVENAEKEAAKIAEDARAKMSVMEKDLQSQIAILKQRLADEFAGESARRHLESEKNINEAYSVMNRNFEMRKEESIAFAVKVLIGE